MVLSDAGARYQVDSLWDLSTRNLEGTLEGNHQMCPQIMRLIFPLPDSDFRDSKFYSSFFPKCIVKKKNRRDLKKKMPDVFSWSSVTYIIILKMEKAH